MEGSSMKLALAMSLILGVVALVATGLSIYGASKGDGEPSHIAFPSTVKSIEVATESSYLCGCAVATGEGSFTITKSSTKALQVGVYNMKGTFRPI